MTLPRRSAALLEGREVSSIAFAQYQVNLYFDGGAWLQIEGGYKFLQETNLVESVTTFPISKSALIQVIGLEVRKAAFISETGSLELTWDKGYKLVVQSGCGTFESYQMFDGKSHIVV